MKKLILGGRRMLIIEQKDDIVFAADYRSAQYMVIKNTLICRL